MAGRVEADFLDSLPRDVIAPERQRIDWDAAESAALLDWGRNRTQELLRLWKTRRGETRRRRLQDRLIPIEAVLGAMRPSERKPVRAVLTKLAMIESIDDRQYLVIAEALISAWQAGRLKDLIEQLGDVDELDEARMIQILVEANMLTDLQMAEIVRTRIDVVRELRKRVETRQVENALRDFVSEHPELISPEWSSFRREVRVNHIVEAASRDSQIATDPDFRGRTDLVLSNGETLLVIEFMRPGVMLDMDHVQRFQRYIAEIRPAIRANNVLGLTKVIGYIIADTKSTRPAVVDFVAGMEAQGQFAMTWATLLAMAEAQWTDQMALLESRSGVDARIAALATQEHAVVAG